MANGEIYFTFHNLLHDVACYIVDYDSDISLIFAITVIECSTWIMLAISLEVLLVSLG